MVKITPTYLETDQASNTIKLIPEDAFLSRYPLLNLIDNGAQTNVFSIFNNPNEVVKSARSKTDTPQLVAELLIKSHEKEIPIPATLSKDGRLSIVVKKSPGKRLDLLEKEIINPETLNTITRRAIVTYLRALRDAIKLGYSLNDIGKSQLNVELSRSDDTEETVGQVVMNDYSAGRFFGCDSIQLQTLLSSVVKLNENQTKGISKRTLATLKQMEKMIPRIKSTDPDWTSIALTHAQQQVLVDSGIISNAKKTIGDEIYDLFEAINSAREPNVIRRLLVNLGIGESAIEYWNEFPENYEILFEAAQKSISNSRSSLLSTLRQNNKYHFIATLKHQLRSSFGIFDHVSPDRTLSKRVPLENWEISIDHLATYISSRSISNFIIPILNFVTEQDLELMHAVETEDLPRILNLSTELMGNIRTKISKNPSARQEYVTKIIDIGSVFEASMDRIHTIIKSAEATKITHELNITEQRIVEHMNSHESHRTLLVNEITSLIEKVIQITD